jgi:oligosaccharide repeat unit polymerase
MILENIVLFIDALVLILVYLLDKNKFIFSPIKLFILVTFLYLILPGFYFINIKSESVFWHLNKNYILLENMAIFVFIVTFIFMFIAINKIRLPTLRKNLNSNIIPFTIILLLLSIYAKYYMYKMGVFFLEDKYNNAVNKVPRIIKFLNNVHLWGYMMLLVYYFRITNGRVFKNKFYFYKLLVLIYFLITILIPILQGRRFGVIFPFLIFFGLYAYYNRINFLQLIKYAFLIFILFTVTTIIRLSQSILLSKHIEVHSISDFLSLFDFATVNVLIDGIISRIGNVYIIFNRIIEYKLSYHLNPIFNSFALAFEGLIPNFLWYNKPSLSIGNTLGKELDLININNVLTGINAGWIGEGFYNLNLLGVALAAFLYAFTIGFFYKIVDKNYDLGKLIFLMYLIFLFSGYQMELAMTFNNFVKGCLIQISLILIITSFPQIKFFKKVKK